MLSLVSRPPRVLLVRHAQSTNNQSDKAIFEQFADDPAQAHFEARRARKPDPELSDTGRAQAEQLAEALAPLFDEIGERALLVSSPMRRALQTAMPTVVAAGLPRRRFICHAELFEIGSHYYADDESPWTKAERLELEYPVRCRAIPDDDLYAGARRESSKQARARVDRVITWFEAMLDRDEHELVVVIAHGNLLTRWLRRWIGVPCGRGLAFVHAHTGMTMLSWDPNAGLLLDFVNDVGHLDVGLRTGGESRGWWDYALPDLDIEHFYGASTIPPELVDELAQLRRHVLEPDGKSVSDHAEIDERNVHIIAWAEDTLAGYVQYDVELGRLRQLIVTPRYRHARLGRRLVEEVELEAMLENRPELLVHAWVESVEFYRSRGFESRGPVVSGPGVPCQVMVKPLPVRT